MVRVTFSLDEATVAEIKRTAARLRTPQSQVVRDAIAEYAAHSDRMPERERLRLLGVLERLRDARPSRSAKDVDAEITAIRHTRRGGGRRHSST